jgi:hypothetical protein
MPSRRLASGWLGGAGLTLTMSMIADPETVAYLARLCRLWPDEELHARADDARWILQDDDCSSPDVCERSRALNLAWIAAAQQELERRARRGLSRGPVDTGWDRAWLDELKARNPLADVARDYVDLRPAGRALVARCPLHRDDTPSFYVYPDDRFHCYGCQQSGDVIAFVQAVTHMPYREAVEWLAARAGVALPQRRRPGLRLRKVTVSHG